MSIRDSTCRQQGWARDGLSGRRKDGSASTLDLALQEQEQRSTRAGGASQSLAALERHGEVQGDGDGTLRLGRSVRGRIRTGTRRDQRVQEGFRWAARAHL